MEIRAAEISAILKQEIAQFGSEADVAEVGQVLSIGDGIARVYGLDTVQAGEMVAFPNGMRGMALNLFNLLYPLGGVVVALIDAGLLRLFHNDPRPPFLFTICFILLVTVIKMLLRALLRVIFQARELSPDAEAVLAEFGVAEIAA